MKFDHLCSFKVPLFFSEFQWLKLWIIKEMFSSFQRVLILLKIVKTNQKTPQNLATADYFIKAEVPGRISIH